MSNPLTFTDFAAVLAAAIDAGFVSQPVCATHDGVPSTREEEQEWNDGHDPCQVVVRIYDQEPEP